MLSLKHELYAGKFLFPFLSEVEIKSTKESISDIMTVKLPKYKKLKSGDIQSGDKVLYKVGYNEHGIFTEFEGFVNSISPSQPYTIECHDYFGELKKTIITKTFKRLSSKEIISQLLINFPEIDKSKISNGKFFNRVVFKKKSVRWILNYLAKSSNYDVYFRGRKLFFCPKWDEASSQKDIPVFEYGKNVIDDSELLFNISGSFDKITVLSEKTDGTGKVITATAGSGKKEKKLYFEDLEYKEALEIAKTKLSELNYTGFKGLFLSFGFPSVWHSQKLKYIDDKYQEKSGVYSISTVEKKIDSNGYRQKIFLFGKTSAITVNNK
ncbi:MAG: hypothetical protein JW982_06425 [Spirochaetes bacterium]|nr:hypothetical protein [Spirochaetota bacterium]